MAKGECKPGFIKSPKGRCVDAEGPTGRRLRGLKPLPKAGPKPAPKTLAKACPAGKLRNPKTSRCISALTLCHKMNGVNPGKWGNATAAACRNALTRAIAGAPARLPAKHPAKAARPPARVHMGVPSKAAFKAVSDNLASKLGAKPLTQAKVRAWTTKMGEPVRAMYFDIGTGRPWMMDVAIKNGKILGIDDEDRKRDPTLRYVLPKHIAATKGQLFSGKIPLYTVSH